MPPDRAPGGDDRAIVRALVRWLARDARPFPWRADVPPGNRDPYVVLVSEIMLQQTQASRVAERLPRFLEQFPTLTALARADEDTVLAQWSGLGYYRRARLLHAAAKAAVALHGGVLPADVQALGDLPGIGPYTAGAIASLAFGQPAPLVDGNVARVLMRLSARPGRTNAPADVRWAWERASELVTASPKQAPALNEALMELGATICTPPPRAPACDQCPIREHCRARARGEQLSIPAPGKPPTVGKVYAGTLVLIAGERLVVEQRQATGLWAALWQAPTIERPDRAPTLAEVCEAFGVAPSVASPLTAFTHRTTHRAVHFQAWLARVGPRHAAARTRRTITAAELPSLGLSTPQKRLFDAARINPASGSQKPRARSSRSARAS